MINGKLSAYEANLARIEEKFQAEAIVVFVVDVPRSTLERYLARKTWSAQERAVGSVAGAPTKTMFTDYATFLNIPIGASLVSSIYFWIFDGKPYPLSQNV
jgi:hypothetical protein